MWVCSTSRRQGTRQENVFHTSSHEFFAKAFLTDFFDFSYLAQKLESVQYIRVACYRICLQVRKRLFHCIHSALSPVRVRLVAYWLDGVTNWVDREVTHRLMRDSRGPSSTTYLSIICMMSIFIYLSEISVNINMPTIIDCSFRDTVEPQLTDLPGYPTYHTEPSTPRYPTKIG